MSSDQAKMKAHTDAGLKADAEMARALELDGEKLRQLTGQDHGPWQIKELAAHLVHDGCGWYLDDPDEYPGQAPCPHCFESSGYVWEHGNDWNSGPWSHQTNIPCKYCNGTGTVDSPLVTADDLDNLAAEEAPRRCKTNIVGASGECLACDVEQGVACQHQAS